MESFEGRREPGEQTDYDQQKWERIQQGSGPALIMKKGRELGVPEEELSRYGWEVVNREIANGDPFFAYRFMVNMEIGTEVERRAIGEQAYQSLCEKGEFEPAMRVAESVYGKDSAEWRFAQERNVPEVVPEREEQELEIVIPTDATFADLFVAIDELGQEQLHFEAELWDHFNPEMVEAILALGDDIEKGQQVKVLDFFKERGFSKKDVIAYLPIKFKRAKR